MAVSLLSVARVAGLLAVLLLACGGAVAQVVITVSSWLPPAHALSEAQRDWCALLDRKTAGKARCNVLTRAVSAPAGTFDAVRQGQVDLSFTAQGLTPGRFVTPQLAEFPFLGDTAEAVSVGYQRSFARTPAMADEHKGVKVLAVFAQGPGVAFNTKRPLLRWEDLLALKWRVDAGAPQELGKALGLNITTTVPTESYELLSTGTMDGTLFPAEAMESFKIDRLVRHATTFPGGLYNTSHVFMMNAGKYEGLPADVRQVVDELSGEFAARLFGKAWDKADRRGLAYLQANGVVFTKADPAMVKAVSDRTAAWVEAWARAAEAKGMKDPKKALADLRADIARLR
jgi:TRAP-type transport system periplasmic protein